MKIIYKWLAALSCILLIVGCNDEWEDEQYEKYLSFVNCGVSRVYLKYETVGGKKTYQIPVQVSGSEISGKDINVTIAVDMDTLADYNFDNYRLRKDLYYKQLEPTYYNFKTMSTVIPAGSTRGYIDVDFSFEGLDTYDNYMLPITIDPSSEYTPNPYKHYRKSLMHLILFNEYSGSYEVTSELVEFDESGKEKTDKIKVENRNTWVVDENTIFFYAGFVDEEALDRKDYQIFVEFIPEGDGMSGKIDLSCKNPDIRFEYDPKACSYSIAEIMDDVQPYLKRRYVTMNVNYSYYDISNPIYPAKYKYAGPMIMQRVYNILMPEEDQIMWQ